MRLKIYIDEAWRWPLAWPVYCGLILLLGNIDKSEYKDSKKLTEKNRNLLYDRILSLENKWLLICTNWSSSELEIDKYWISKAINISICRWLYKILFKYYHNILIHKLKNSTQGENIIRMIKLNKLFQTKNTDYKLLKEIIEHIEQINWLIIDWNRTFWLEKDIWIKPITIIDWDDRLPEISMASIIAKVDRDAYMNKLPKKYSKYGFTKHKWYWTQEHMENIVKYWISDIHRICYLWNIINKFGLEVPKSKNRLNFDIETKIILNPEYQDSVPISKPKLLIHVCCAPDLARPLRYLKEYFKLYLFRYNPNIQPKTEYSKRYDEYTKLCWLEKWDYEIVEDRYDPNEFFDYMYNNKRNIWINENNRIKSLEKIGSLPEWSSRCDLCYLLRLEKASEIAVKKKIPYFTTTLLISPKKSLEKLHKYWIMAQEKHNSINNKNKWSDWDNNIKYLQFDFRKKEWYKKTCKISIEYWLYRQNHCGCIWSNKTF